MLSSNNQHCQDMGFRSPGIPRRNVNTEEAVIRQAKKSKRSKSIEAPTENKDDGILKLHKISFEDPMLALNKRWSVIAKTQDAMTKQEIMNNYRLLMNDHLRLERFFSIIKKDNEIARNRLETDLLDAMMCIEDLKQALEIRMARRRKIDPHESEERRSLIRQNKKLLNQLYESAKIIERLEITKLEMKEQLELLDFQMMEVENQKNIIEEELKKQPVCETEETQTDEDLEFSPAALALVRTENRAILSELGNQRTESAAFMLKYQHLDNLVRELQRDNSELREQLLRTDDSENSLTESDKHTQPLLLQSLHEKDQLIANLQEKLQKSLNTAHTFELQINNCETPMNNTSPVEDLQYQTRLLQSIDQLNESDSNKIQLDNVHLHENIQNLQLILNEKDVCISQLRLCIEKMLGVPIGETNKEFAISSQTVQTDYPVVQTSAVLSNDKISTNKGLLLTNETAQTIIKELEVCKAQILNNNLDQTTKSLITEDYILEKVQELRQSIEFKYVNKKEQFDTSSSNNSNISDSKEASDAIKLHQNIKQLSPENICLRTASETNALQDEKEEVIENISTVAYFENEFEKLQNLNEIDAIKAKLCISEKRCVDLEQRIAEAATELTRAQNENRLNDTSLAASRRTEAALRRRLLATMDTGGRPDRSKTVSSVDFGYPAVNEISTKDEFETQAKIVKLEATNAAMQEAIQLNRMRLQEKSMQIVQLEAEHRTLQDRMAHLQVSEACGQRSIVRLQALYNDMLREFSESTTQKLTTTAYTCKSFTPSGISEKKKIDNYSSEK